jgi:hypothetical protein
MKIGACFLSRKQVENGELKNSIIKRAKKLAIENCNLPFAIIIGVKYFKYLANIVRIFVCFATLFPNYLDYIILAINLVISLKSISS